MTPATIQQKELVRGDTFNELFIFQDANEQPIDLTSYGNIIMDIRKGTHRNAPLIGTVSLGNGIAVTGASNNELTVTVPSSITDTMQAGTYYRDIRFVNGTTVRTLLTGFIKVIENVTTIV